MVTKLKLEINGIKFSATGSENFVMKARDSFEKKYLKDGIPQTSAFGATNSEDNQPSRPTKMELSSYESRLGLTGRSVGSELGLAAGCWLTIEKGVKAFSSDDWRDTMKKGDTYQPTKHRNNFTTIMRKLVKDSKFIKRSSDQYTVDPQVLKDFRSRLEA